MKASGFIRNLSKDIPTHTMLWLLLIAFIASGFGPLKVKAFDVDTHFYMKYGLLRLAGFTDDDARKIAAADVSTDEGDTAAGPNSPNNKAWHALGNAAENQARRDYLRDRATSQAANANESGDPEDRELALIYFGQLLHFIEDMYSHQDHDVVVYIMVDLIPIYSLDVGHLFEGHLPDHLSSYEEGIIDAMVTECLNYMADFFYSLTGQISFPDLDAAWLYGRAMRDLDAEIPLWKRPFVSPKIEDPQKFTEGQWGLPSGNLTRTPLYKYDEDGEPISFAPAEKFGLTDYWRTSFDSVILNITNLIAASPSFPDHPEAGTALTLLSNFVNEMEYPDFPIYNLGYSTGNLTGLSSEDDGVMNCTIVLSLMMSNLVEMRTFNARYVASLNNKIDDASFNATLNQAYDEAGNAWTEIQKMKTNPHDVNFVNLAGNLTYAWRYLRDAEQIALYAPSVGGFAIPADKFALLAPYIGLAFAILAAAAASTVYVKRVKRKEEKQ